MGRRLLAALAVSALLLAAALVHGADRDPCKRSSTPEIEACLHKQVDQAQATMERYLAEARKTCDSDAEDTAAFDRAQIAWLAFFDLDCKAVYEHWADGTARGAQFLGCKRVNLESRTCDLWFAYLQGTVTRLPKPSCPGSD